MPLILALSPEQLATLADLIAEVTPTVASRARLLDLAGLRAFERKIELEGAALDFGFGLVDALQWRNDGELPAPALRPLIIHLATEFGGLAEASAFLQSVAELAPVEQPRPLPLDPDLICPAQYQIPEPFAGRDEALAALLPRLQPQKTVVLQGVGGVGKTTLAYAAAHRLHQSGAVCSVLYADVTPTPDPVALLRGWATVAGMEPDFANTTLPQLAIQLKDRLTQQVRRACVGGGRVLVLIDNVFDNGIEAVNLLKSAAPGGAIWLVVTRSEAVADALNAPLVRLEYLTRAQGARFLRAYLTEESEGDLDALEPLLGDLSDALGGHALALKLGVARIKKEARRPSRTLLGALERLVPIYREGVSDGDPLGQLGLDATHPAHRELATHSLSHSFLLSYEELADTPPAQAYFRAMGVLAYGAPVDLDLLSVFWECEEAEAESAAELLCAAALLERTEETGWYRQHPLLRSYARALLTHAGEAEAIFSRYATLIVSFLDRLELSELVEAWAEIAPYLPHVTAVGDALALHPAGITAEHDLRLAFALLVSEWLNLRRDVHRPAWLEMGRLAATALENNEARLLLTNQLVTYYARVGNRAQADALQQEAFQLAEGESDPEILTQTYYFAALAAVLRGNATEAMQMLEACLPYLQQSKRPDIVGATALLLGLLLVTQGSPVPARYYLEMALPELKTSGDRLGEANALLMLGQAYALLGQPDLVIQYAQEASGIYTILGLDFNVAGAQLDIAEAWLQKGDAQRTYDILVDVMPRLLKTQDANVEMRALSSKGFACALLGNLPEGFALAGQTIALARAAGNNQHLGNGFMLLGALHAKKAEPGQAIAEYGKAYDILLGSGHLFLAGLAALQAGTLSAGNGDATAGETWLRLATDHLLDAGSMAGVSAAQQLVALLQARGESASVEDILYGRWLTILERVRVALIEEPDQVEDLRDELVSRHDMLTGLVAEADPILPLLAGLIALLDGETPAPLPEANPLSGAFNRLRSMIVQ